VSSSPPEDRASLSERSLSRIPFDPREERVIDSMARWMGMLGRFQVLAGGFMLLLVIGGFLAYGTTEALEQAEPAATETTPPLISLGDIDPVAAWVTAGVFALVGALVLRGGILLTDSAEDFERMIHRSEDLAQHHLEGALRQLRAYFVVETLLAVGLLAAALLTWGNS
jgi:hypothetical protein